MIYLFKRASNDLNRVITTLSAEIVKDKQYFEARKSLLQFFTANDLGADDIALADSIKLKLVEVAVALSNGDLKSVKALIERLDLDVKLMVPASVLEFVGLDFNGKKNFNFNTLNFDTFQMMVSNIASAYNAGDKEAADLAEIALYEFVIRSELHNATSVLSNEALLDLCATYLKKSKDPEAKMIAFLIQQAKA